MATIFNYPTEKRYASHPRRYLNEYHVDGRQIKPIAKGSCATLASARTRAANACEHGFCSIVRIFDRKIGQYLLTYKATMYGYDRHEGYTK